jgi:hypothetical protein
MKVAVERSILVAVILPERPRPACVQTVPTLEQEDFMKQIVEVIVLAFLQLMVSCSSMAPRAKKADSSEVGSDANALND